MITVKIIIGANYGDEGKGLATHYFAEEAAKQRKKCLNVLYNGGCQRGHTVETAQGRRHVFHHFGAGTFDGAVSYLHDDFIVNPMEYMRELCALEHIGVNPVCFISPQCRVTTPYDMLINRIVEEERGKKRHGSCGMGIWETVERYCNTNASEIGRLSFYTDDELRTWLSIIREKYLPQRLEHYNITRIPQKYKEIIDSEVLAENYIEDLKAMINHGHVELSAPSLLTFMHQHDYIIFEGAQGLALDERNSEEYPHVTASKTGSEVPMECIKSLDQKDKIDIETVYVTRSYITRHGAGYLPGECNKSDISPNIEDYTNRPNEFQGKLRYARLNGKEMIERIKIDISRSNTSKNSLMITHINETDGIVYCRLRRDDAAIFDKLYLSGRKDGIDRCHIMKHDK